MRQFYVCSYGGSGSKMLVKYLENFGKVFHIHSRFPPDKLTHSGGINNYIEWFNNNVIDDAIVVDDLITMYRHHKPLIRLNDKNEHVLWKLKEKVFKVGLITDHIPIAELSKHINSKLIEK